MIVRALFFASYRDLAGTEALEVDLPENARAADLVSRLRSSGGRWESLPANPAVAINEEYARLSTGLKQGDEVAFIPPVAGG